ncbi:hypothetical protein [Nocardioides sp. JQ2195]|nr:hypothetical protein [Nocardioides sp. JQ2195]
MNSRIEKVATHLHSSLLGGANPLPLSHVLPLRPLGECAFEK